jgi:TorA maturation chaperone TorD
MTEGAQPADTDLDAGEQARADIYRLLGGLLAGPPDAALLELLRAIPLATDAEETAMTTAWEGLRTAAVAAEPDRVQEEYFNLFIGLGRGELVPYASFYIHGLLMEKVLASLRTELAGLGIERQANVAEPEDHAAAICEVMGMIILEPGLHSRQAAFFRDYLSTWLGKFFTDLETAENADFYQAVAQLGQQFLALEARYFSLPK